jgi:hypothetical protein
MFGPNMKTKKICLAIGLLGIVNFAQANPITIIPNGGSIDGVNAYEYLIKTIPVGTKIATASITFNNVTLTTSGGKGDDISLDLVNRNDPTQTYNDGDTPGDYFQSHTPYSSALVALGAPETFFAPYQKNGKTVYDTQSWTYTFTGIALTDLISDVSKYGYFDLGIDPDCIYTIGQGGIVFNYTTGGNTKPLPDQSETLVLLGLTFAGLLAFRHKLCPA